MSSTPVLYIYKIEMKANNVFSAFLDSDHQRDAWKSICDFINLKIHFQPILC